MSKRSKRQTISTVQSQSKEVTPTNQYPAQYSSEQFPVSFDIDSIAIDVVGEAKPIVVNNFMYAKGIMNAYTALVLTGLYPYTEVGLHLRTSLDDLARVGMGKQVGYLLAGYAGKLLSLVESIVPDRGIVELDYAFGTFSVNRVVSWVGEHSKGEPEWVTRDRNIHRKHFGMDLILSGTPLLLKPFLPSIADGMSGTDRVRTWVTSVKETLDMTPEDALAKISARTFNKIVNKNTAKSFATMERAVAEGKTFVSQLQVVPLHDGGELAAEELVGKTIRYWNGSVPMPSISVTEANLQVRLETALNFNFEVEVIS
jgi:hypothetical protein